MISAARSIISALLIALGLGLLIGSVAKAGPEATRGSALPDPNGVLEGEGKKMRHIKFSSERELERTYVRRYIRAAIEELGASADGGTGKSVVKTALSGKSRSK